MIRKAERKCFEEPQIYALLKNDAEQESQRSYCACKYISCDCSCSSVGPNVIFP